MTDNDLDIVYTSLCKTMTQLGQSNTSLFLARFAMLAIDRIDDAAAALNLIDDASEGMPESAPQLEPSR